MSKLTFVSEASKRCGSQGENNSISLNWGVEDLEERYKKLNMQFINHSTNSDTKLVQVHAAATTAPLESANDDNDDATISMEETNVALSTESISPMTTLPESRTLIGEEDNEDKENVDHQSQALLQPAASKVQPCAQLKNTVRESISKVEGRRGLKRKAIGDPVPEFSRTDSSSDSDADDSYSCTSVSRMNSADPDEFINASCRSRFQYACKYCPYLTKSFRKSLNHDRMCDDWYREYFLLESSKKEPEELGQKNDTDYLPTYEAKVQEK